ncbi:MAG: hypothetical protein JXA52_01590 [Planctomycetes bacterium]|nr:hypothetical protein [Planctomycetota bacterium]
MAKPPDLQAKICIYGNSLLFLLFAFYFFLIPGGIIIHDLSDPALNNPGIPRAAIRLFYNLTPKYEEWARKRVSSNQASALEVNKIAETEWPLFGSVFYLWAVEALQQAWEKNPALFPYEPKAYARGAIAVAAELVMDPGQAAWVKKHWGEDYLHQQNVFYRMLTIAAATVHYRLLGDEKHLPLLRDQVESLAAELAASPSGLLEDYPGECYPGDVLTAITCIQRADAVLGTDHTDFVKQARRGFAGVSLDNMGLPPYASTARTGTPLFKSRGCGNSYVCLFAPELWPEEAKAWYQAYEKNFWQERWSAVGFREFCKDEPNSDWYMDVDSGPVLAGHGIAACAFGAGAARMNGRFDHAYPLASEMLTTSWPLPDGTLAGPRILSNAIHAPFLGEAAILWLLTCQPDNSMKMTRGSGLPLFVYLMLGLYVIAGLLLLSAAVCNLRRWRQAGPDNSIPVARLQFLLWLALLLAGGLMLVTFGYGYGFLPLLLALLLPKTRQLKPVEKASSE